MKSETRKLPKFYECKVCGKIKENKYGWVGVTCSSKCNGVLSKGRTAWNKGKKFSLESRKRMSEGMKGRVSHWRGKHRTDLIGENNPNWKGGVSVKNYTERKNFMSSVEYKEWRRKVFERDKFVCVHCGLKNGDGKTIKFNADHIKPYYLFPDLRLSIENGRTLCEKCHKATPTFAGRMRKFMKLK